MKPDRKITVLVVDDHTIVRNGVIALLSAHAHIEVVGEAGNGRNAVELARAMEPDVVLMDIGMPELNGLEATRQITRSVPGTKVLILSGFETEDHVLDVMNNGASGYLLKSTIPAELEKAIVAVSKGQKFISPVFANVLAAGKGTRSEGTKARLTSREREILQLIAEGRSHLQIADLLNISIRTVDTHRNNILKKLDLHDAAGLVNYAVRNGIVLLPK